MENIARLPEFSLWSSPFLFHGSGLKKRASVGHLAQGEDVGLPGHRLFLGRVDGLCAAVSNKHVESITKEGRPQELLFT